MPGVSVSQGQGILGSSARVWLRGPSSIVVNEPLLIIDGARTHGSNPFRLFEDRDMPSRLEHIDMETVERVEVLRGPAASAIYGPGASKGVILITTKRGRSGPARWTAFAESGPSVETTEFPANFGTLGVRNGLPVTNCPLADQAVGSCTPTSRRSWNPIESASPFRTGWTNGAGLTVSGGAGPINYFVAGSHDRAEGVYETDRSRATSAHIGLSASPVSTVDVNFTGGYRVDLLRHPAESWIFGGLFGESADDPVRRGYSGSGYQGLARQEREEDVHRTTLALNTAWRSRSWLQTSIVLGYDRLGADTDFTVHEGSTTFIERASDRPETRSGTVDATAAYAFRGMAVRSSVGIQHIRENDHGSSYDAAIPDVVGGPFSIAESSLDLDRVSTGIYLQQHFGWKDRLFLTGSLRADRSTVFGVDLDETISPSVDLSWVGIGSTSSASSKWLGELRSRGAYGRGGAHRVLAARQQQSGFPPIPSSETAEEGSELEVGADASLMANRVRASVTYYRATISRGLERFRTFQGEEFLSNSVRVRTSGVESSIDARLFAADRFNLDMGVILTTHRDEVKSVGGPPLLQDNQASLPGEPIGEYFSTPYSYADANGDGLLAPSEIAIQIDEAGSVGSPFPEYEAALRTEMTFGGRVHLSAILDRRGGAKLYNEAAFLRCRTRCVDQNDPATSLADQSRQAARAAGTAFAYIEKADHTKLREVRVALTLPSRVAGIAGASSARISITGRNLYTWTPYRGLDPEIISARHDSIEASDSFYQPTLRSFVARLDLAW